ncbi:DUF4145 domain-containing protein [Roseivirga seohaensis]|uniref:DUF4145 domain-containing protein n=1 Tax=Roseivirga seohaensis TaxID=1914963 RepID=UPI003BA86CA9
MHKHIPPSHRTSSFNCPSCGAFAQQTWAYALKQPSAPSPQGQSMIYNVQNYASNVEFATCSHCSENSIWLNSQMIYPSSGIAPLPNTDMPEDIRVDYMEAREIISKSPKGAAALLRLAVQKLCQHLGEKGENINTDIKNLVQKGLPDKMQKALDSVRVIGNNAVHPGQINIDDRPETAIKLFGFINVICEIMITQPKQIDEFYELNIPDNLKEAINKRDGK